MATSPLLLIPHIAQGQKQKEVTANQAFNILESAIAATSTFDAAGTASVSLGDVNVVSSAEPHDFAVWVVSTCQRSFS